MYKDFYKKNFEDSWVGDGCGGMQFCRQRYNPEVIKRRKFLKKYCGKNIYPFMHNINPITVKNREFEADPLILPLVEHMNKIEKIQTLYSCQGHYFGSPYVCFTVENNNLQPIINILSEYGLAMLKTRWYWDRIIVCVEGFNRWMIQFYDTIALVKFTKEYLKIPIIQQLILPVNARIIDEYKSIICEKNEEIHLSLEQLTSEECIKKDFVV